jgi:hypothetical protein
MLVPQFANAPDGPVRPRLTQLDIDESLQGQVQHALNLALTLKSPAQMLALLAVIKGEQPKVFTALANLNYVHFARFLPSSDGSTLWVITTYDGDLDPYIMDFVAVLGDVFTKILYFVKDAPPLPVHRYPREFVAFIKAHNNSKVDVWSAYPELTVIDIQWQASRP